MIDLHAHLLPAVDDGVETIEEARALARAAAAEGVTAIAATPHVRADHPTRAERMEEGVAAVRADFAEQGIAVEVLHGGELDLDFLQRLSDDELRRFSLGQTGRYLLVEFPWVGWPLALEPTLFDLRLRGFTALLAHPERNGEVQVRPDRLRPLVEAGSLVQVTAESVDGRAGVHTARAARALLDLRLVHVVASDAHRPSLRAVGLDDARAAAGDETLGRYLTEEAPRAIAAGEEVPPPPAPAARPRRGRLRGR